MCNAHDLCMINARQVVHRLILDESHLYETGSGSTMKSACNNVLRWKAECVLPPPQSKPMTSPSASLFELTAAVCPVCPCLT